MSSNEKEIQWSGGTENPFWEKKKTSSTDQSVFDPEGKSKVAFEPINEPGSG